MSELKEELSQGQLKIASAVETILGQIGEDQMRQGLLKTPERVAKAYGFLTQGYEQDPVELLRSAIFDE
jgi:GTP cyclohydrolase I